jgi:predicted ester cyclase
LTVSLPVSCTHPFWQGSTTERSRSYSTEENKAFHRRFLEEVWNKGNIAAVDELIAANYVGHFDSSTDVPIPPEFQLSLEQVEQDVSQWHTTFPDLHFTVELQVAEGGLVVTRLTARGTHTGEYRGLAEKGIPPTGKQVTWTETWIDRITDGKIVEAWGNQDALGRLQQIGALPTPE